MNAKEQESFFVVPTPAFKIEESGSPMTSIDYNSDGSKIAYSNNPGKICVISAYDGSVKQNIN